MKKYLCEFVGTLVLVLFGCGTAVFYNNALTIALAFGISVIACSYAIGEISGAHINPSVSFAMFVNKKLSAKDLIGYISAQVLGGICGAGILAVMIKLSNLKAQGVRSIGLGANGFLDASTIGISMLGALLFEIMITALFVFVVLSVTKDKTNKNSGIIIGLTLTLVHILGIPVTGTSVNPARSFGPAILLGFQVLEQVWVFIIGPMVGASIAALTYKYMNTKKKTEEEIEEEFINKINEIEKNHIKKINEKEAKETKKKEKPKDASTCQVLTK